MQYHISETGDLHLQDGEDVILTIPSDGSLGIYFERADPTDGTGGILLKHGSAENVLRCYQRDWAKLQRVESNPEASRVLNALGLAQGLQKDSIRSIIQDLEMITIPVAELNDAIVDEVNACLAISGRVGKLRERLEAIRAETAAPAPGLRP